MSRAVQKGDRVRHPSLHSFGAGTVVKVGHGEVLVRWDDRLDEERVFSGPTWVATSHIEYARERWT